MTSFDNKKDSWMLAEDIPNCDLFFSQIWLRSFVNDFQKHTGRAYKKVLCRYEGYHLWFYFGERDSYNVAEYIIDRMLSDEEYVRSINPGIQEAGDKLRSFALTIPFDRLNTLSNHELWQIFAEHYKVHTDCYTWFWIGNAVDMFHANLTNRLKLYLKSRGLNDKQINETFITLTTPTRESPIFEEQEGLLRIGAMIEKDAGLINLFRSLPANEIALSLPSNIYELIKKHWQKYHYTKFIFVSGEFTLEDYINQLKDIFTSNKSPSGEIARQRELITKSRRERENLLDAMSLESNWRAIFDAFSDFMVTKIYRRFAQLFVLHRMDVVIKETAKRLFITPMQVRFMLSHEIYEALANGKLDEEEVLKRTKSCVYYAEKNYEEVFVGKKADELLAQIPKKDYTDINELRGEIGCPGYGKGKVKIIIRAGDMKKMQDGDILVSIATDPDIVPAMKRAAAIVTEQGGVTSHAAIVSRELNIPCVIGTKIATKVLKDGDLVEVDANKGLVKKIIV